MTEQIPGPASVPTPSEVAAHMRGDATVVVHQVGQEQQPSSEEYKTNPEAVAASIAQTLPGSVREAELAIKQCKEAGVTYQQEGDNPATYHTADGTQLSPEAGSVFMVGAARGVAVWKLTSEERKTYRKALASGEATAPEELRNRYESSINKLDGQSFEEYVKQALSLSSAIAKAELRQRKSAQKPAEEAKPADSADDTSKPAENTAVSRTTDTVTSHKPRRSATSPQGSKDIYKNGVKVSSSTSATPTPKSRGGASSKSKQGSTRRTQRSAGNQSGQTPTGPTTGGRAAKDAGDFNHYEQRVYSNGAVHVYAKDAEDGKLTHLSHDAILKAYGYDVDSDDYKAAFKANQELQDQQLVQGPDGSILLLPNPNAAPTPGATPNILPQPQVLTPKSLRERLKFGMRKAFEAIAGVYTQPDGGKRYNVRGITGGLARLAFKADIARMNRQEAILQMSQEEQRRHRRIVGGVIGAVAVLGAAYATYKGLEMTHHASAVAPSGGLEGGLFNPPGSGGGSGGAAAGAAEHAAHAAHLSLGHHGDTIWSEVTGYAHQHGVELNDNQAHQIVGHILKANGQTWESARHLPVGYHFNISPEELDKIFNLKKAA